MNVFFAREASATFVKIKFFFQTETTKTLHINFDTYQLTQRNKYSNLGY